MKTLIISDYDCGCQHSAMVYENQAIIPAPDEIDYDIIYQLQDFAYNKEWRTLWDEFDRKAQEAAQALCNKYLVIILCIDGDCKLIANKLAPDQSKNID